MYAITSLPKKSSISALLAMRIGVELFTGIVHCWRSGLNLHAFCPANAIDNDRQRTRHSSRMAG